MQSIKSVAVIGAGPAGAIAVDALMQERAFEKVRVFERQEKAGGCWVSRDDSPPKSLDLNGLAARTADAPLKIPDQMPCWTPLSSQDRFMDSPVYPGLETNVDVSAMCYSQEPIPAIRSQWSIERHGEDTPFRHHSVIRQYIEDLFTHKEYDRLVEYNTTVERAIKEPQDSKWTLTLRRTGMHNGTQADYWWTETFDAVVVASGHYAVPYIPAIPGLTEFARQYPGSVEHTKHYRGPEKYRAKKVITVGASVSAADTAVSLIDSAKNPIHAVVRGRYNPYFGDDAFKHPRIRRRAPISRIESKTRTVYFEDGTFEPDVDHLIFGTGFTWTLPFLPQVETRNNRIPNLYQHVFYQSDPTLAFVGAVGAGLTFKVFEWQAVAAARVLAGRATLPPREEQAKWEIDRIALKGDGPAFTAINPDFETYFEGLRQLAGRPSAGSPGRVLPPFDRKWVEVFSAGHVRRKEMWSKSNAAAAAKL
ncbi:Flavin-containing monooxygenase [Penicillium ucsense]|uniref:Flavin-containing monooxygenase n=1 Tax=Penicillium ucsense TaxID=2839758 RepID=A0A8J8WI90_9EURO|nr:Flavin-containing monooxygenase [Penicillium ucsense]KAF7737661.1 Flavin-containing monooxygenase [Penicillium ucsense]